MPEQSSCNDLKNLAWGKVLLYTFEDTASARPGSKQPYRILPHKPSIHSQQQEKTSRLHAENSEKDV